MVSQNNGQGIHDPAQVIGNSKPSVGHTVFKTNRYSDPAAPLIGTLAEMQADMVVNPKHYELFEGIEVMHVIKEVLGEEGFKAYCHGNMIKYALRRKFNMDEDIAKIGEYVKMHTGEKG